MTYKILGQQHGWIVTSTSMSDLQAQNEALQQEVARLKREAELQRQNEALQREIEQLKKAAGLQGKLASQGKDRTAPLSMSVSCRNVM